LNGMMLKQVFTFRSGRGPYEPLVERGCSSVRPIVCVLPFGGGTTVWSYSLCIWAGICVASLLYWYRYGEDPVTVPSLFWGYAGVGGSFWLMRGLRIFSQGGLAGLPGLLAGGAATVLLYRLRGIPVLKTIDRQAPYLAIAHGCARIGCFLAGCCYGKPAPEGWGVVFPAGSPAALRYGASVAIWPTQLMESLFVFLLSALLFALPENRRLIGYAAGYGAGRFVLEFFRGDALAGVFPVQQLLAAGVAAGALVLLCFRMRLESREK